MCPIYSVNIFLTYSFLHEFTGALSMSLLGKARLGGLGLGPARVVRHQRDSESEDEKDEFVPKDLTQVRATYANDLESNDGEGNSFDNEWAAVYDSPMVSSKTKLRKSDGKRENSRSSSSSRQNFKDMDSNNISTAEKSSKSPAETENDLDSNAGAGFAAIEALTNANTGLQGRRRSTLLTLGGGAQRVRSPTQSPTSHPATSDSTLMPSSYTTVTAQDPHLKSTRNRSKEDRFSDIALHSTEDVSVTSSSSTLTAHSNSTKILNNGARVLMSGSENAVNGTTTAGILGGPRRESILLKSEETDKDKESEKERVYTVHTNVSAAHARRIAGTTSLTTNTLSGATPTLTGVTSLTVFDNLIPKVFNASASTSAKTGTAAKGERLVAQKQRAWTVDDFVLGKPLGKGKFGNVYLGRQKLALSSSAPSGTAAGYGSSAGAQVALKVLFKAPMVAANCVHNLRREVEIQHRLQHPNIVQLYGYFHDQKNVYLVLEYCPGGELYKQVSKLPGGRLPEPLCREYILDVAAAIAYMHERHVYHRDIKPENLLLSESGSHHAGGEEGHIGGVGTGAVRLCLGDFGWAVHAPPPHHVRYTMCGTPEYMAPEIVAGFNQGSVMTGASGSSAAGQICSSNRCNSTLPMATPSGGGHERFVDLWCLGVLMYELLIGISPFLEPLHISPDSNPDDVKLESQKRSFERILRHSFGQLTYPAGSAISPAAKEVLNELLHPTPHLRPAALTLKDRFAWFKSGMTTGRM